MSRRQPRRFPSRETRRGGLHVRGQRPPAVRRGPEHVLSRARGRRARARARSARDATQRSNLAATSAQRAHIADDDATPPRVCPRPPLSPISPSPSWTRDSCTRWAHPGSRAWAARGGPPRWSAWSCSRTRWIITTRTAIRTTGRASSPPRSPRWDPRARPPSRVSSAPRARFEGGCGTTPRCAAWAARRTPGADESPSPRCNALARLTEQLPPLQDVLAKAAAAKRGAESGVVSDGADLGAGARRLGCRARRATRRGRARPRRGDTAPIA